MHLGGDTAHLTEVMPCNHGGLQRWTSCLYEKSVHIVHCSPTQMPAVIRCWCWRVLAGLGLHESIKCDLATAASAGIDSHLGLEVTSTAPATPTASVTAAATTTTCKIGLRTAPRKALVSGHVQSMEASQLEGCRAAPPPTQFQSSTPHPCQQPCYQDSKTCQD